MNLPPTKERSRNGCLLTVVEGARQQIVSGNYVPGQRLPTEPQLQEEWGVSRSVVREAMKILASQGLVRVEQGRGTFVNEVDNAPLRQQFEIALLRNAAASKGTKSKGGKESGPTDEWDYLLDARFVLEVGAAERAARHAAPSELDTIQRTIETMRRHPGDAQACGRDDYEFHHSIAVATRNPLWPALLGSLHDLLSRYLVMSHHGPDNGYATAEEHEAIWVAIRDRNSERAGEAMRRHLKTSELDLATARRKRRVPRIGS